MATNVKRSPDGWLCQITDVLMGLVFAGFSIAAFSGRSIDEISRTRLCYGLAGACFAVAGLAGAWSHRVAERRGERSASAWRTAMLAGHATMILLGYAILRLLTTWSEGVIVAVTLTLNEIAPALLPTVLMPRTWSGKVWHQKLWIRFLMRWVLLIVLGLVTGVAAVLLRRLPAAGWLTAAMLIGLAGIGLRVSLKRRGAELFGLDYNSILHLFNVGVACALYAAFSAS